MDIFIQQMINGLTLGAVYAMVALGYTMVYGIIQLINFAHGEVVMFGAMVAFSVIGVSIILQHVAMMIWSRNPLAFPQIIKVESYPVAGATITSVQIAILSISLAMMAGLAALVYRTRLGTAMRATAQNPQVAGLMGIDADRVVALTFVIGAALAAVAGVMVASYYGIAHYTMGSQLGLKAFCAAVLGGIGNLPGAMLGGVLLGVVEALGAGYIGDLTGNVFGSNYQDVFAFIVLIAVLVLRPSGLLGERVGDRA